MKVFTTLVLIVTGLNSSGYTQDAEARTRYYGSFSGYHIPFRPAHELNPVEVKGPNSTLKCNTAVKIPRWGF
jgi:hypothetical protein